MATDFSITPLGKKECDLWVKAKHYSRRAPIFWAGFGLVIEGKIEGVCIYGQPSPPLQKYAFKDRDFRMFELCRLVVQTSAPNAASYLVGNSLQVLPKPCAVVSYADTEWGHFGIIYQATNWLYTGSTRAHDKTYLVDGVKTHPMTLRDRGITDPARWARENSIPTLPSSEKHRYFFFVGDKRQRKTMRTKLTYPEVTPYPKGQRYEYDAGPKITMHAHGY